MSYTEILNSEVSKSKNVIYKFVNLINNKVYIGQTRKKRSESAKKKWKDPEYRKRYKKSRKEYIEVVKLSLDGKLIEIYPTFTDAEKSIYGHKNSPLWYALRRCKKTSIELEGFKWMLLKSYLTSQESRK